MICHIVFESEYSYRYFQLIRQNFSVQDHVFIIHGTGVRFNLQENKYTTSFSTENFSEKEVNQLLTKAKAIIISGYFSKSISNFFFDKNYYTRKISWLVWGGDIFRSDGSDLIIFSRKLSLRLIYDQLRLIKWNIMGSIRSLDTPFRYDFEEIRKKIVIRKIANIICVCQDDYKVIKENYNTEANYIYAAHPLLFDWEKLHEYLLYSKKQKTEKKDRFNLLIGNSGSSENRHLSVFQLLQSIQAGKYKVFCPLSYGDSKYISQTLDSGINIFHDSFFPIIDKLHPDEYNKFLCTIDVAFMNHQRQEALGTIITLLLLGTKVYMKFNISSHNFLSSKGLILYNIDSIHENITLSNIVYYPEKERQQNQDIVIKEFSDDAWLKRWQRIFSQIQSTAL